MKNFFSSKLSPASVLVAVLVMVLAVAFSWRIFFYNAEQSEFALTEKAVNELNQKDFSNLSEFKIIQIRV